MYRCQNVGNINEGVRREQLLPPTFGTNVGELICSTSRRASNCRLAASLRRWGLPVFVGPSSRIDAMSDADRLLDLIEESVVEHGGDLGGWTRRSDDGLQLFDGRVTLRAELHDEEQGRRDVVHTHLLATLHEHDAEVLDACVFGMGNDRDSAVAQAAGVWMMCVAGPIKSFIDNKPVCMTCQAGVQGGDASAGYSRGDYGLPGLRAFVGPSIARGFKDDQAGMAFDDSKPWFRYAAQSAAPRPIHLAKATVQFSAEAGWLRELEIDGHEVSHRDRDWPGGNSGLEFGYATRFAVFEFPRNSSEIERRAELDRAIRYFAEHLAAAESADQLMEEMVRQGFDADLVHEVESVSTIAFGRLLFESHGVKYAPSVIRARRDGGVETDVPLMSIPAYSRGRAIAAKLRETMPEKAFQAICLYTAESNALSQAIQASDNIDLREVQMFPCIVPDRGVSNETMAAAMTALNAMVERKRPAPSIKRWWKFW
jgi:hypothetical protein